MRTLVSAAAIAAVSLSTLSLAACGRPTGSAPQGSDVAAAMPDTSAPRNPDPRLTAPDAGATGVAPADGSAPETAPTPAVGTAGGSSGVTGAAERPVPPGGR